MNNQGGFKLGGGGIGNSSTTLASGLQLQLGTGGPSLGSTGLQTSRGLQQSGGGGTINIAGTGTGATATGPTGNLGSSLGRGNLTLGSGIGTTSLNVGLGSSQDSSAIRSGGLKLGTGLTLGSSVSSSGLELGTGLGQTVSNSSRTSGLSVKSGGGLELGGGLQLGAGISTTMSGGSSLLVSSYATTGGGRGSLTTMTARGLGGVDPTQSFSGKPNKDKDGESKAVMKQVMPDELNRLADNMLKFIKAQKGICEDISSASERPLSKVQDDVKSTAQALSLIAHAVHADGQAVLELKNHSVQELKNVEIAQRTKDTPPGLQHENTLPAEYFKAVVQSFDQQMQAYKQQIDDMENYMATLTTDTVISPQVLADVFRKLHESFIGMAGQIQSTHEDVKVQKEQYLNYRKAFLNDTRDVFEARRKVQSSAKRKVTAGPSPFGGMSGSAALAAVAAANAVAAPTIQSGLATTLPGSLQLNNLSNSGGLQLQPTGGLSLTSTGSGLGASLGQQGSTGLQLRGASTGLQLGSAGAGITSSLQLGQSGLSGSQAAAASIGGVQQKPFQLQPVPAGKRGRKP